LEFSLQNRKLISNKPLDLDHVFCFVDTDFRSRPEHHRSGFNWVYKEHKGQGTSNACALLGNKYLELIWANDLELANTNILRLGDRHNWRDTDYSPLGLALKGDESYLYNSDFEVYPTPYGMKIPVLKTCLADPTIPLIFIIIESEIQEKIKRKYPLKAYSHKNSAFEIRSIELVSPTQNESLPLPDGIDLIPGKSHGMRIYITGKNRKTFSMGPVDIEISREAS